MGKMNATLYAFNRGIMSPLGMARVDQETTALRAEIQNNAMPRALGSMMLRAGSEYLYATKDNLTSVDIPFVYSLSDMASVELTNGFMRVAVNDAIISRVAVSTAITNGTFTSDLTGWTDADETGATSDWLTGGYMSLVGTGYKAAIRKQTVTVAAGDQNKEHALRIIVTKGKATLRVGSGDGLDDYISETSLGVGEHSLAFTPTGNFYVMFSNYAVPATLIDSIAVEAAGVMTIATPWLAADLSLVRWDQSADVIYVACKNYQQRKIERRGTRSWSIVLYRPEDGPFRNENQTPITIAASARTGDVTLTASASFFKSTNVGSLFKLSSVGQTVDASINGEEQYTDMMRVIGNNSATRTFNYSITGTWAGTVRLQRSDDEGVSWVNVTSWTSNAASTYYDSLENVECHYRLGIIAGGYTSGTAVCSLTTTSGSISGVVRVTGYASPTSATAQVLKTLGGTAATKRWREGIWSDRRGWPTCPLLEDGRLWWFGKDRYIGSVSDAYESFDDTIEGDSAPIIKSFGSGPVDDIAWALGLQRLAVGAAMGEHFIISSSLDEPLTPTASSRKTPSTQGCAPINAAKIDNTGVFVSRSGNGLFSLTYDESSLQYSSEEISKRASHLFESGIKKIAVQRKPDTRVHCVLNDGTCVIMVYDPLEKVQCLVTYETDGLVEDVTMFPSTGEDTVIYTIARTVNGSTVRYKEKWAQETDCQGGDLNKQADCFIEYDGAATNTLSVPHLIGESVVVWADGLCLSTITNDVQKTYTVSAGGVVTLDAGVTVEKAIVGLPYTGRYKSSKLTYAAEGGTALCMVKKVEQLGIILHNTHPRGIKYGRDFDNMDHLPEVIDGEIINQNTILAEHDEEMFMFDGSWGTDSRICLEMKAPMPCTVLAVVMGIQTNG